MFSLVDIRLYYYWKQFATCLCLIRAVVYSSCEVANKPIVILSYIILPYTSGFAVDVLQYILTHSIVSFECICVLFERIFEAEENV